MSANAGAFDPSRSLDCLMHAFLPSRRVSFLCRLKATETSSEDWSVGGVAQWLAEFVA